MKQALEIVRFRVDPDRAEAFVSGRRRADEALESFAGFLGSELSQAEGGLWHLSVRWASLAAAQAAQQVTLASPGLPALNAWIALAEDATGFETVEVRQASPQHPSSQENHGMAIATRFATLGLGRADMATFDELVSADVVVTTGLSPKEPIRGRDAYKSVIAGFADAWPVQSFVVHDIFASGDKVCVRFTATAVFEKDYFGVGASRAIVPLDEMHVYTIRNGKIVDVVVGAVNLPYEFIMYPALKDMVLGDLATAP